MAKKKGKAKPTGVLSGGLALGVDTDKTQIPPPKPYGINNHIHVPPDKLASFELRRDKMLVNGAPILAEDTKERTVQAQKRAKRKQPEPDLYLHVGNGKVHLPDLMPRIIFETDPTDAEERTLKEHTLEELMSLLHPYTIPSVYHNSLERHNAPRCYEGTRMAVLEEIMDWVDRTSSDQSDSPPTTPLSPDAGQLHTQFLWIQGPVGCGKSSITQTVAEMCEEKGKLASDFFFPSSQSTGSTQATVTVVSMMSQKLDIHKSLVPTLASQLVVTIPAIRPYISREISRDAHIFSRTLHMQLTALIIKPFMQLETARVRASISQSKSRATAGPLVPRHRKSASAITRSHSKNASTSRTTVRRHPHLIIIDALDKCGQPESQKYILTSLSSAIQQAPSSRVSFLISSRPEQAIRDVFDQDNGALGKCTHQLVLDDKYNPDEDIRLFLRSKFQAIVTEHPLGSILGQNWPPQEVIELLVKKASGQFVYASTVMKFIGSPRGRPSDHLETVLNFSMHGGGGGDITETRAGPFAELDELYTSILMSIDEQTREKVLTVLAFLSLTSRMDFEAHYYPTTSYAVKWAHVCKAPAIVEAFLGYEAYDLLLAFADLRSIVEVPSHSSWTLEQIRLLHPFLLDFLHDRARAGSLFVDIRKYAARFASRCIDLLVDWLHLDDTWETFYRSGSRTCHLAYQIFLQLFAWECPAEQLKRDLTRLPVQLFIERLFHGEISKGNFSFLPLLFGWLKNENLELHNEYNAHYEAHMKSRLLSEILTIHTRWKYIFTAISLNSNAEKFQNIFHFLDRREEEDAFRNHFFPLTVLRKNLDTSDYLARLAHILTRHKTLTLSEQQMPHIDISSYAELGIEIFDCLTVERKWMEPNWETSIKWDGILDVFCAILSKIPGEVKLTRYLSQNGQKRLLDKIRVRVSDDWERALRTRIEVYVTIQENHVAIATLRMANREGSAAPSGDSLGFNVPSSSQRVLPNNHESTTNGAISTRQPANGLDKRQSHSTNGKRDSKLEDGVSRTHKHSRRHGTIQRIMQYVKKLF